MNRDIFDNKYKTSNVWKVFFANIVCFLIVAIVSIGFCYSYFADNVDVSGETSTARVSIDYRQDANTTLSNVYAKLNNATATSLNNIKISPGDKLTIQGYAVNTSTVDVYLLGRLEIINKDANENIIDTETIWFNIANNKVLYVERGLFQVGASTLATGASQALSYEYVFEGERYTNDYDTIQINLSICSHQKDFLDVPNDYVAVNGYSAECIFATHSMTGRYRNVFDSTTDADVIGLTLSELRTDDTGAYLINSCKDWFIVRATSTEANSYHDGKTFKLNAYLDFNNTITSKSIDTFKAEMDGQGYTISNWIDSQGVIGYTYGNISNLGVDGVQITYTAKTATVLRVGGLVGAFSSELMTNCFVIGASVYDNAIEYDLNVTCFGADNRVGGLVGNLRGDESTSEISAIVQNCYTIVNIYVTNSPDSSTGGIGGVIGQTYPPYTQVEKCYFSGKIIVDSLMHNGLIAANISKCNDCFAITDEYVGKQVGIARPDKPIINCAYINNTDLTSTDENYNKVIKVGENQTDKALSLATFKSSGLMRDAFGWATSNWTTDIYTGNNGLVLLRVFYTY